MTFREVLKPAQQKEFEYPPLFTYSQRKFFFTLPAGLRPVLRSLEGPINRVGFVLQWGYFRSSGRFFKTSHYYPADVSFVSKQLDIAMDIASIQRYDRATISRHRQLIRTELGFIPFGKVARQLAQQEALHLVSKQVNPAGILGSLCEFLRSHRMEIPTYHALTVIITEAFEQFEQRLFVILSKHLDLGLEQKLNALFDKLPSHHLTRPINRLTELKNAAELMQLSDIRENMVRYKELKELYYPLLPLVNELALSEGLLEHYAQYVLRAEVFQVKRRKEKYLLLICFIVYQYHYLSDILVQTLMNATTQVLNQAKHQRDRLIVALHQENEVTLNTILEKYLQQAQWMSQIQQVAFSLEKTREEKFDDWMHLMQQEGPDAFLKLAPWVEKLRKKAGKQLQNTFLYQAMTEKSRKLMTRIADILRHLELTSPCQDEPVGTAIDFYQAKGGNLTGKVPTDFLSREERKAVEGEDGFNVALYKVLLAKHTVLKIKSGRITSQTSHSFKSMEDYLIPEREWTQYKQTLLERASLRKLENWSLVKAQLEEALTQQFHQTFTTINAGENLEVRKRKNGTLRFLTPKTQIIPQITLYPVERIVPIFEVLHTVNRYTHFTDALSHLMSHNQQAVLPEIVNFATILSWGCNIGLSRMAQRSKNISASDLEKASNWYLTSKNVLSANDCLVKAMESMPIAALFKKDLEVTHSSSDGQKYTLALDSIHATYSPKYFGKEKGITIYSFISEHFPIFYTTVFSASDYEAWYVFDGLMHQEATVRGTSEAIPKRAHTTDSHGVSELNFAISYLIDLEYQPRMEGFHKAKLHGIAGMRIQEQADYLIRAGNNINVALIEQQWDNILRLIATLKLKYSTPSTVLKRLTSYAHQHPLYQALTELGKVVKTIFLLKYMHHTPLRQRVQHQTTKIESVQKLADRLNLGGDGLIPFATKEELLVMARCKQLIINSISCYNYILMTKRILEAGLEERKELLEAIPHSAAFAWEHINFQGEYDFSEEVLKSVLPIDFNILKELTLD